jgi:hypothetical protein
VLYLEFGVSNTNLFIPAFFTFALSACLCVFVGIKLIERVGRRRMLLAAQLVNWFGLV